MTTVVISQPMLFPWPGFFEQMTLADVYLWLDDAQFSRGELHQSHANCSWRRGEVVVEFRSPGKGSFQSIGDLVAAEDFRARHIAFLNQAFAEAPYRALALEIVEEVYAEKSLCDLLIASVEIPAASDRAFVSRAPRAD